MIRPAEVGRQSHCCAFPIRAGLGHGGVDRHRCWVKHYGGALTSFGDMMQNKAAEMKGKAKRGSGPCVPVTLGLVQADCPGLLVAEARLSEQPGDPAT